MTSVFFGFKWRQSDQFQTCLFITTASIALHDVIWFQWLETSIKLFEWIPPVRQTFMACVAMERWQMRQWNQQPSFPCFAYIAHLFCSHTQKLSSFIYTWSGPWFNIKMSYYQYRKSHCGDKTVVRSSYLHNRISYTGKTTSLYWDGSQVISMVEEHV